MGWRINEGIVRHDYNHTKKPEIKTNLDPIVRLKKT